MAWHIAYKWHRIIIPISSGTHHHLATLWRSEHLIACYIMRQNNGYRGNIVICKVSAWARSLPLRLIVKPFWVAYMIRLLSPLPVKGL
jgi:hypothetical protein